MMGPLFEPIGLHEEERLRSITLASKGHWGYSQAFLAEWGSRLRFPPEYLNRCEAYFAQVGGEAAGFYAMLVDGDVAVLDHLWVLPGHIGTGLGRRLLAHAVERARFLGFAEVELEADIHAVGFYQHMGARQVRTAETRMEGTLPIFRVSV